MARNQRHLTPTIKERSMTALSLLLLVGLFSIAGGILAFYFLKNPDLLFADHTRQNPVKTPVHVRFEDGKFEIPDYLLVKVSRTALRSVEKINLVIPLNWVPDQAPVAFTRKSDMSEWLLASIAKRTSFLSDQDRLNNIFRFYIAAPATAHPSGLLRYRFKPESPYDSIELFTDELQDPGFLIRCELQSSIRSTRLCSRQIPISSRLTMLYKFPRSQINQWQQIHKTMQNLLAAVYKRQGV